MNYLKTFQKMIKTLWMENNPLKRKSTSQTILIPKQSIVYGSGYAKRHCEFCICSPCEIEDILRPITKVLGTTTEFVKLFDHPENEIRRVLYIHHNSIELRINTILVSEYNGIFNVKYDNLPFVTHYFQEPAVIRLKPEDVVAVADAIKTLRKNWKSWDEEWADFHNIVFAD